jgi:hypothetical protein
MTDELAVLMVVAGIPACFARLWWIWWQSWCGGCGNQRKMCVCPAGDHMMRPRR